MGYGVWKEGRTGVGVKVVGGEWVYKIVYSKTMGMLDVGKIHVQMCLYCKKDFES